MQYLTYTMNCSNAIPLLLIPSHKRPRLPRVMLIVQTRHRRCLLLPLTSSGTRTSVTLYPLGLVHLDECARRILIIIQKQCNASPASLAAVYLARFGASLADTVLGRCVYNVFGTVSLQVAAVGSAGPRQGRPLAGTVLQVTITHLP
jgi:hypothetical protein